MQAAAPSGLGTKVRRRAALARPRRHNQTRLAEAVMPEARITLDDLAYELLWVAWRNEPRADDPTTFAKVPWSPIKRGRRAKANDPHTWGNRSSAERRAKELVNGAGGGIGIELADLDDGTSLCGVDLDTCLGPEGFEPWAQEIIDRFSSYTEVSPSGTGAKIFFRVRGGDRPVLLAAIAPTKHGRKFKRDNGTEHPPAIELHVSHCYYTVTCQKLDGSPDELVIVPIETLLWLLSEAGPRFAGRSRKKGGTDDSRSAKAFRLGLAMRGADKTFDEFVQAVRSDPETTDWAREKGDDRQLQRIWEKAGRLGASAGSETLLSTGVSLEDFFAYMPQHSYVYIPTRALWPAASVDSRIQPIPVGPDEEIAASTWLDQNRPIEQMTWAPGLPEIIEDRLLHEGGWREKKGVRCFNLYVGPAITLGDPAYADLWVQHVHLIYPEEAEHIIDWLAHRAQHPHEKINHALVLGGSQGIGKDTLLEPVKYAIGPWNFAEASPSQVLGRFNGFVKSVILRVSEARDLGDSDRFKFYDHMKAYTAAPPDVLRVDEKYLREHQVVNVCGVIITTNHKTDGIYLPADDRRNYVAWSDRTKEDECLANGYWPKIYGYYANGGIEAVAAYLMQRDISGFNPKEPPPKTEAFWAIVNANHPGEEGELLDALDRLNALAFTLRALQVEAESDLAAWLGDRKNRRVILHRLETCGYVPVRNPDAKSGLWVVNGQRQVVYASASLSLGERFKAAQDMAKARVEVLCEH
jgi:hypothetical protein